MTNLKTIMTGPRLKVQRANRHIDELRRRTSPLDRELYDISVTKARETVIHMEATKHHLTYTPKQPIPETLALIIGDTVHNFRAALDHLAKGILRAWGAPIDPKKRFYFPLAPRKDLVAHSGLAPIEQALPGSKKLLLQNIRPDNGPNEPLWAFNVIDNDDKHSLVVPVVSLVSINNINARTGGIVMQNCGVRGNAAYPQKIINSGVPIAIQNNFETTVDVKFGDGTPFKNEPVVPTLSQISRIVSETLNEFERLIRNTKNVA